VIQVDGFDLLFAWSGFVFLLLVLSYCIFHSRCDAFDEFSQPPRDHAKECQPERAAPETPRDVLDGARIDISKR
jgi:hypothetical protein